MKLEDLMVLTPGFIGLEFLFLLTPTWKPSDFVLMVRSLIFSAALYAPFLFVRQVSGIDLIAQKTLFVPLSWALAIVSAVAMKFVLDSKWFSDLYKFLNAKAIHGTRIWNIILASPDKAPVVRARCSDGSVYIGAVEYYTLDPNDPERELFLRPAYLVEREERGSDKVIARIDLGVHLSAANLIALELAGPLGPAPRH